MFNEFFQGQRALATVVAFFVVYFVALTIGRLLKRRAAVRLGFLFQFFALTLAFLHRAARLRRAGGLAQAHRRGASCFSSTALIVRAHRSLRLGLLLRNAKRQIVIPQAAAAVHRRRHFSRRAAARPEHRLSGADQLKGLLAGSGVVAIILGFGMQNLLSTLVAGAELQIGKPYKLGDWLQIGEHIGQVMEINWADTRLRTNDAISIEIPNNKIVEETIINLSCADAVARHAPCQWARITACRRIG